MYIYIYTYGYVYIYMDIYIYPYIWILMEYNQGKQCPNVLIYLECTFSFPLGTQEYIMANDALGIKHVWKGEVQQNGAFLFG